MIAPRRRGAVLLTGLGAGALVVGVSALVSPARPVGTEAALTAAAPLPVPPIPLPVLPVPTTSPAPTSVAPTTAAATRRAAPTTTAAPAAAGPEEQVVALTNRARARAGCGALRVDARLARAARAHSRDMVDRRYFEHDSPDGRTFSDREEAEGYPDPGGENIAYGQESAQEVMTDWLDSPGHRRNILDCSFVTIGVGLDTRGMFWTQDFGR